MNQELNHVINSSNSRKEKRKNRLLKALLSMQKKRRRYKLEEIYLLRLYQSNTYLKNKSNARD